MAFGGVIHGLLEQYGNIGNGKRMGDLGGARTCEIRGSVTGNRVRVMMS